MNSTINSRSLMYHGTGSRNRPMIGRMAVSSGKMKAKSPMCSSCVTSAMNKAGLKISTHPVTIRDSVLSKRCGVSLSPSFSSSVAMCGSCGMGVAEKGGETFLPLVRGSVNTLQGSKCSSSYRQFGVVAVGFEAKRDRLAACVVPVGRAFILFVLRVVATGEHIRFPGIAGWYGCLIC